MTDSSKYILHNFKIIPWEDAKIHVMSHVLHYGSGVFEGIKCYETSDGSFIYRLEHHIERLLNSASMYRMKVPFSKEQIINGCKQIVSKNRLKQCYIRPLIFYGYDTLGVDPKECPVNISIAAFFWGAYLGDEGIQNGVNVTISPYEKFSFKSMPSTAKASGQYMNSLLAVTEARSRGYDEALLLNSEGNIAEGSGQNIFYYKDGVIHTNDEKSSILLGLTRETIIQICDDIQIETSVHSFTLDDILDADEVFFTGTASEVTPIRSINDKLVNNGIPGPITLKLRQEYMDIVMGKNPKYMHWLTDLNYKLSRID